MIKFFADIFEDIKKKVLLNFLMADKKKETKKEEGKEKDKAKPLDDSDISLLKRYGRGAYFDQIKKAEEDLKDYTGKINKLCGVKESDTGLSAPSDWLLEVLNKFIN